MKKRMRRLAVVLAGAFLAVSIAGCGGENETGGGNEVSTGDAGESRMQEGVAGGNADSGEVLTDQPLPLCQEKEELTVWISYVGTMVTDLNDIEGVKKLEELTNVHINWIPVNQDEVPEKYGIMVSSGEYPDIVYAGVDYPGGFEAGVDDGVIYEDMDTLIRTNMPNYMALLESSDQARREATSDSGKMLICRTIVGTETTVEAEGTFSGLSYRADLLEKLGLDVPVTIDEWHDALVKAKEAGIENPFVLDVNGGSPLALSWGVSTKNRDYLQLDGAKVVCSPALDSYGDYLETMRQWYAEGLINPNFSTFHYYLDTPVSVEKSDTLLYSTTLSAFTGNNYYKNGMCTVEEEFLQPITAPKLKEGDKPLDDGYRACATNPIYITTGCKNPELAARWLDFLYSEQGQNLCWYGVEGVSYELDENGIPQFTDLILKNPDGLSPNDARQLYCLNGNSTALGRHIMPASWKLSPQEEGVTSQQLEAVDVWSSPETNISLTASITLTADESAEVTNKLTAIKTMVDEYTMNYIVGQDVAPFEEFQQKLNEYGLQEVLEIYQAAYDRYLAR